MEEVTKIERNGTGHDGAGVRGTAPASATAPGRGTAPGRSPRGRTGSLRPLGEARRLVGIVLAGLVAVAGCGNSGTDGSGNGSDVSFDMEAVDFAPGTNVVLDRMERRPSGLYVEDLREGEGAEAAAGNRVAVHYTGWLPDGTQFDSSRDSPEPFQFTLGAGQVIQGWDEGVAGMREGGERRLVVPPDLAYGSQGAGGVIPPNSPLVFEVELVEVLDAG